MEPNDFNAAPELLTVQELAARLRLKPSWVYTHADELRLVYLQNTTVLTLSNGVDMEHA